jgi:hypothetical protein
MIWLAWRQFRTQFLVVLGVLAALAVILAVTGTGLVHQYDTAVLKCSAAHDCGPATSALLGRYTFLQHFTQDIVLVVPALIGIFWGAPLVARELETGSWRLAWTQSVTRGRWLAVKLALVGGASMLAAGLLSLMVTWWSSPFDAINNLPFGSFDERDIVPVAYAAFAFALGVALGVLVRRTLPAMAATLVVYASVLVLVGGYLRPRYQPPISTSSPVSLSAAGGISVGGGGPGAWLISSDLVNRAGQGVLRQEGGIGIGFTPGTHGGVTLTGVGPCPNKFPSLASAGRDANAAPSAAFGRAAARCVASFHLRAVLTYQPASRYWPFQWYEAGLFLVLALGLVGFTFWWVRRRLT